MSLFVFWVSARLKLVILFVFWVSARLKLVNMAGESSSNLPAGWVQGTERKEDGTKVKVIRTVNLI